MAYVLPVGRVYHSDAANMYTALSNSLVVGLTMSANSFADQIRFELNAYEPYRVEVHDPRAEKFARLNLIHGWWGRYARGNKRIPGFRRRGTPSPAIRHGVQYISHRKHAAPSPWKLGRRYQSHDRC